MTGDVGEREVPWADELDGWAFEHGVVFFANEARGFNRFLSNVVDVLSSVD